MPLFFYQAFSKDGKKVTGYLDAPTSVAVKEQLVRQGLFPTTITFSKEGARQPFYKTLFAGKVTTKEKILFTKQLSVLLKAGIPLVQSVELLIDQFKGKFGTMLIAIKDDLKEGSSFANALNKYPDTFDKIYVQLVRAGEASGKLEPILDRLVIFFERSEEIRKRIRDALMQPIIQLVVATIAVTFLVIKVVPSLAKNFSRQGQTLPAPTRILMGVSEVVSSYYLPILIIFVVFFVGYRYIKSTDKGGRFIDKIKLKIPLIGYFARIKAVVQFSRTLGLLIASGVNLSESLDIVVSIIDNKILAGTLKEARDKIIKQGKIAQYLKQTNLFPPIAIYMISTGEESGQLDTMLITVANNYEEELAEITDKLTGLLSPMLLIVMAGIVGFIVAAITIPMLTMAQGMMSKM